MQNGRFIPGTDIEIIREVECGHVRYALFDFDGTISLIREGWQGVMIPMMVDILMQTPHHESRPEIEGVVKDFVSRLTGKQTIYQMLELCAQIRKRRGNPEDALTYKYRYPDLLAGHIRHRVNGLQTGVLAPADFVVPGSVDMLKTLVDRGIRCFLASGTDEKFVLQEAALLEIDAYFHGIYGAQDDYKNFSKKMVIDRIIADNHLGGREFLTFGDGYVEIEDTKSVGGIAVGIASNEAERQGVDTWKRNRLIEAGADLIAPDFRDFRALSDFLLSK